MNAPERRLAGARLLAFLTTDPLGEELAEGTMGGLMAGASQLGSDQEWGQTALETAAAIAGGIGMGMLGRRIGAGLGKRIHRRDLANQEGLLASAGRMLGSETTAQGLKHQGQAMKSVIQESLVQETSARLAREAALDPAGFVSRYGITPEQLQRIDPQMRAGRTGAAALRTLETMPPEQRKAALDAILSEYEAVENAVAREASRGIDRTIESLAKDLEDTPDKIPGTDYTPSEALRGLLNPAPKITGEHVGRAAGRFLGDEIGIIGGLAAGSLLAQQLGMDSPKDRRIRELESQLRST